MASAYGEEAERLRKLKQSTVGKIDRMKLYLLTQMDTVGIDKIMGDRCTISAQDNSALSVTWPEGLLIPKAFERTKIELDKSKVIAAWEKKKKLPSGVSVGKGRHLRIR